MPVAADEVFGVRGGHGPGGLGLWGDGAMIAFATGGPLLAIFLVVALGYLDRHERHLDWEFLKARR